MRRSLAINTMFPESCSNFKIVFQKFWTACIAEMSLSFILLNNECEDIDENTDLTLVKVQISDLLPYTHYVLYIKNIKYDNVLNWNQRLTLNLLHLIFRYFPVMESPLRSVTLETHPVNYKAYIYQSFISQELKTRTYMTTFETYILFSW